MIEIILFGLLFSSSSKIHLCRISQVGDSKLKFSFDYLKKAPNHLAEEGPITSDSEGEEMQTRILNRKPNRYLNKGYKQSQSLYRPPCFDVACPVDDSYPM